MAVTSNPMTFTTLLSKFPLEWRGVFDALQAADRPVLHASQWLRQQTSSKFGSRISWKPFVMALCEEEPTSQGKNLIFMPRICLFPMHLQRHLVMFLHHHRTSIPTTALAAFLKSADSFPPSSSFSTDYWLRLLLHSLCVHTGKVHRCSPGRASVLLTGQGASTLDRLCEKSDVHETESSLVDLKSLSGSQILSETSGSQIGSTDPGETSVKRRRMNPGGDMADGSMMESQSQDSFKPREEVFIDADTEGKIAKLREIWSTANADQDVPQELGIFAHFSPHKVEAVCQRLDLQSLPEAGAVVACRHIASLGQAISFSNCVCFARHCLLPKIAELSQNASRFLQAACVSFCKQFPGQVTQAVLKPMMAGNSFGGCQADIVCKIIKESFNTEYKKQAFGQLLECDVPWHEPMLQVVQLLIEAKPELENARLSSLLIRLEDNGSVHQKNLKFGKLILATINKYGRQMPSEQRSQLNRVVEQHQTFLKRSLSAAMKKM